MSGVSEPEWLNEQQALAWRSLLAIVNRAFPEMERTLKANDLLTAHYTILVELSEAPDQTLGLSALADAANLSQSRLTHRMRALVDAGDVHIVPDAEDGRAKNAQLSAGGLARLEAAAPHHVADVQRLIFDHLDDSQTEAVAEALSIVADALCRHPEYLNPSS